ncbi:MAG TPA: hypothetical protein VGE07_27735 [Herpetosiphonaceae bacterium]
MHHPAQSAAARWLPARRRALRLAHAGLVSAWVCLLLIVIMLWVAPHWTRSAALWVIFLTATWLEHRFNDRKLADGAAPLAPIHLLLLGAVLAGSFPLLMLAGFPLDRAGWGAAIGAVIGVIHAAIRFRATPGDEEPGASGGRGLLL